MLLLLMRASSHPAPFLGAQLPGRKVRDYTTELLAAALFVSGWCVIRLLFTRDTSHGLDAAIAVSGLLLGVGTAAHCVRSLVARGTHPGSRCRARGALRYTSLAPATAWLKKGATRP